MLYVVPKAFFAILCTAVLYYVWSLPLGTTFREIGAITACIALLLYWLSSSRGTSQLCAYRFRWAYAAFLAVLLCKSISSNSPGESWYALANNAYHGFALFLAGVEVARSGKVLRGVVFAVTCMLFYVGLDGIYQWFVGVDFIRGYPMLNARIGASFETGRIGNLVSMLLPLQLFALPSVLPDTLSSRTKLGIAVILAVPALAVLLGAQSRSAWVGFSAVVWCLAALRYGWRRALVYLLGLCFVAYTFVPERILDYYLINDPRWEIWESALAVFWQHPLLGAGVNAFEHTVKSMGIVYEHPWLQVPIPHPHNIYVQLLAEVGLVGAAVGFGFFFTAFVWASRLALRAYRQQKDELSVIAVGLSLCCLSYFMTALSAHNFFRSWWLALFMTTFGLQQGTALLIQRQATVETRRADLAQQSSSTRHVESEQ